MGKQAVEWPAAAATDPQECTREWDRGKGTALLATGRYRDVLSVPDRLGLLALDILWRDPPKVPGPTLVDVTARRVDSSCRPIRPARVGLGVRHVGRGRGSRYRRRTGPPGGWSGSSAGRHRCPARPVPLELALRRAAGTLAVPAPGGAEPVGPDCW